MDVFVFLDLKSSRALSQLFPCAGSVFPVVLAPIRFNDAKVQSFCYLSKHFR